MSRLPQPRNSGRETVSLDEAQRAVVREMVAERDRLDTTMRGLLRDLEMCAAVGASGYGVRGSSSDESLGGGRPPGDVTVRTLQARYGRPFVATGGCSTNGQRREVIADARRELEQLRRRDVEVGEIEQESIADLKRRIVRDGEGFTVREVAVSMRCSERLVVQARREVGRDLDLGHEQPEAAGRQRGAAGRFTEQPDARERDQRIRDRAETGMTITQIARLEAVSKPTVERALGRRSR